MASFSTSSLELSDLSSWRGLRPGMSFKEVRQVLTAAGVSTEDWDAEDDEFFILDDGWGFSLHFDERKRLTQIAVENDDCTWEGKKIVDVPLHEALLAMQPVVASAGWRIEDPTIDPTGGSRDPAATGVGQSPPSDAKLLYEGTVWLPGPGLALVMCGGAVCEIVWRETHRVPKPFVSEITASQLELSLQPNLAEHLLKLTGRNADGRFVKRKDPVQRSLNWLLLLAVAVLGVQLYLGLKAWHASPIIEGKFTNSDWVQGKIKEEVFHVTYLDPSSQPQTAALKQANFYVVPREPETVVDLRYLGGNPPVVYGVAHSSAPVVERLAPTLFIVGLLYVIGSILALGTRDKRLGASA